MTIDRKLRPPARTIRGMIFDMDGVLADTNPLHYAAWKQMADEEGLPFSESDHDQMLGLKREDCLNIFLNGRSISPEALADMMERKNRYFHSHLDRIQLQPVPGVVELIDQAQALGLKLGVGSSSRNAKTVLAHLGLLERFSVVGDGHTVHNSKPAPDVFLWVAGALRLHPLEVLIVEDALAGVYAALRGGFRVIGLGDCHVLHEADHCVDTLVGLDLAALIATL